MSVLTRLPVGPWPVTPDLKLLLARQAARTNQKSWPRLRAWAGESAGQRGWGNSRSIGQCVLMNGDLMTM
jgi:hypothetical protein